MHTTRLTAAILGMTLLVSTMAARAAGEAEWPGWRGPQRDGRSPDTGLLRQWPADGPKLLWKADGIGHGFSTVAVAGGMVYTTGDTDGKLVIYAFDMQGEPVWNTEHDAAFTKSHGGARSTPVIDGSNLYLVSGGGRVACYDAKTGQRKWAKELTKDFGGAPPNWGYAESVLIYQNLAIVTPGGKNCIVALDKETGQTVWMSTGFTAGAHYGGCLAITYEGIPMIVAGTQAGLVFVSAKDGKMLWTNDWCAGNTANCPTPVYADGYVFWANGYGKGGVCVKLGIDAGQPTFQVAWTSKEMNCQHGGYIIDNGCVYGNHGNEWACLDLKTGQKKWSGKGVGKGSICFADGMLYLYSEKEGVVGLATASPDALEMKGTFKVAGTAESWAHPVVIGRRMYIRYDSNLYCFDVKAM